MARQFKFARGIGERLGEARGDMSREQLAKLLQVSPQTVGNYERGDSKPDSSFLARVGEELGVDLNWLITGVAAGDRIAAREPTHLDHASQIAIPRFDIEATAGDGAPVLDDRDDGAMLVDRNWLAQFVSLGRRVSMITARGESMEPVIRDGDVLLVEHDITEADVRSGGVFVVTHHGGLKVKRLEAWSGGLRLSSDAGPRYGEEIIPDDRVGEDLVVHGRVFWTGGRLRDR